VREQTQLGLHDRYRSADVLLVDDIQFMLTRSENFQEHVFNTFNTLLSTGKQLVLSSDQSPRNMSQLQDRLRSRLLQGLIVEVNQPDFETRVAILEAKAEMERVSIPRDVIDYIANRVRDSIRELEGSVTMLRAHSQLLENEITLDFAKKYLGNLGREQAVLRADDIIDAVATRFGFTAADITGHARVRPLAHARHIAMYLVRDLIPNASYPVIARQFGNRNHTSVISAVEKIKSEMSLDAALTREITELRRELTDGNY
jgi:chromosomal replication initiator protein